jgi:hypothetical protein
VIRNRRSALAMGPLVDGNRLSCATRMVVRLVGVSEAEFEAVFAITSLLRLTYGASVTTGRLAIVIDDGVATRATAAFLTMRRRQRQNRRQFAIKRHVMDNPDINRSRALYGERLGAFSILDVEEDNVRMHTISLEDCIGLCGLHEEQVAAIGEHEHISEIATCCTNHAERQRFEQ